MHAYKSTRLTMLILLSTVGACASRPTADPLGKSHAGSSRSRAFFNLQRHLANNVVPIAPYTGGYPRATRQENCVDPRNDHKLKVELPWPDAGYLVVDLPQSLIAGPRRLFLAHLNPLDPDTERFSELPTVSWTVHPDGRLDYHRVLPDGVAFSASAVPHRGYVDLSLAVVNHSDADLVDLRLRVCVLLKNAAGFSQLTRYNKHYIVGDRFVPFADVRDRPPAAGRYGVQFNGGPPRVDAPLVAVLSAKDDRAIVTVWEDCFALPCRAVNPCLHCDPALGNCPRDSQVTVRGRIYFVTDNLTGFYQALLAREGSFLPSMNDSVR